MSITWFTEKKCNRQPRNLYKKFLEVNKIKHISDNGDIYMPCGYLTSDSQLKDLGVTRPNQYLFAISGCDYIVSKRSIWVHLVNKYGRKGAETVMPKTWVLGDKNDMDLLMRDFEEGKLYIMKNREQAKKGLKLTHNLGEILKGHEDNYIVVQQYLDNVYTINRRKLNLRLYVLIVCKNKKKTFYIHDDGICIYTAKEYNPSTTNMENTITSYNFDGKIYSVNPLTVSEFKRHIKNQDSDKVFSKILKKVRMVVNSVDVKLCKFKNVDQSTSFQLFGIDVIFDKNLEPYLLEFNKGPNMSPDNYPDPRYARVKERVIFDIFDVVGIQKTGRPNGFHQIR